jgi:hypothetical protein
MRHDSLLRVTDYIDQEGRLRTCYGHPSLANRKIRDLIGIRPAWSEKYETIGGARTWSEAKQTYDITSH